MKFDIRRYTVIINSKEFFFYVQTKRKFEKEILIFLLKTENNKKIKYDLYKEKYLVPVPESYIY